MTPDTYEQMDRRISRIETQIDQILARMDQGFQELRAEINALRNELNNRFYWLIGLMFGMWAMTVLAILLK